MIHPLHKKIEEIRQGWGERLLILGHHYQREEVLRHVDAVGDSLELARIAASDKTTERIIFCGVSFMAETADILSGNHQFVYMPVPSAGCPLADTASISDIRRAWNTVMAYDGEDWLPVVYINSTAEIKAFVGENDGLVCTSGNAAGVFQHVLSRNKKVFFMMDRNLGMNTANDLGFSREAVGIYDPAVGNGGVNPGMLNDCRILLWNGGCYVHAKFTEADVEKVRSGCPEARIIVHPEVSDRVAALADAHGSTSQIIRYVEKSPEDSIVYIGTETKLVERLARRHAGRVDVRPLTTSICAEMSLTTAENLLALLEKWPVEHQIHVPDNLKQAAGNALETMLLL